MSAPRDGVGLIEVDRRDRRNALDVEHCHALEGAVADMRRRGVHVIVVSGAGSSFCSGADFGEVYTDGFRDALHAALRALRDAPLPVVAAVNGPAIGAGTQLAIACDLRVAAPSAVFGVPTARIGLAVDPWTVRRLAEVGGGGTARSLLVGGVQIDAELALHRGLVDRIGQRDDALTLAAELAALAPLTLAYHKLALDRTDLAENDPILVDAFERCWSSADMREGQRARAEKRPPRFTGQ